MAWRSCATRLSMASTRWSAVRASVIAPSRRVPLGGLFLAWGWGRGGGRFDGLAGRPCALGRERRAGGGQADFEVAGEADLLTAGLAPRLCGPVSPSSVAAARIQAMASWCCSSRRASRSSRRWAALVKPMRSTRLTNSGPNRSSSRGFIASVSVGWASAGWAPRAGPRRAGPRRAGPRRAGPRRAGVRIGASLTGCWSPLCPMPTGDVASRARVEQSVPRAAASLAPRRSWLLGSAVRPRVRVSACPECWTEPVAASRGVRRAYSPQSSSTSGARDSSIGSTLATSNSAPQSRHATISAYQRAGE